ncbi:hypothetical protein K8R78_07145 [bacterium]|nr:hypothetical protein [bacterium]
MRQYSLAQIERITGIRASVAAYWIREFPSLGDSVTETDNGQLLSMSGIEQLLRLRLLLVEQQFTLSGARRQLEREAGSSPNEEDSRQKLFKLRDELVNLRDILEETPDEATDQSQ